ncbi:MULTISPECIES: LacI family DNA-binding transcriptional regulator [Streptomyces]|nr:MULTISPECIES: LacI family DNA-binding transcriptional regulator [Streptomyces]
MVTMSDVAKAAGVSAMTVSNVLNGHPHVSEETRRRVTEAVERLGYRMNVAARNLRSGTTGVIGLAIPDIDQPYYGRLASLVIAEAARRGYRVAVEQTGASREGEAQAVANSRLRTYDGLIIATVELGDEDAAAVFAGFPVVALGERISEASVDHVGMANFEGTRDATLHLVERGCRRIAAIGGRIEGETGAATLRTAGYLAALDEAGLPRDDALLVPCPFNLAGGVAAVRQLAADGVPFDGLMCLTDSMALGALRGLADLGRSAPGDALVTGFDDVPQAAYAVPSLTTVAPGHAEMVTTALELLTERMAGRRAEDEARNVTGPHRLIIRESTGG